MVAVMRIPSMAVAIMRMWVVLAVDKHWVLTAGVPSEQFRMASMGQAAGVPGRRVPLLLLVHRWL